MRAFVEMFYETNVRPCWWFAEDMDYAPSSRCHINLDCATGKTSEKLVPKCSYYGLYAPSTNRSLI